MNQFPDYTRYTKGVVLSANDVIANVLLLYDDEGYSPLNVATVDLPPNGHEYRTKSREGKSLFQRGDLIEIDCKITEQKKQYFTEEQIDELCQMVISFEDEEQAELMEKIFDREFKFATEWAELEKRDLSKREEERKKP